MTKIVFAAAMGLCLLMAVGVLAVSGWALALAAGGLSAPLFRRRKRADDGEVSC